MHRMKDDCTGDCDNCVGVCHDEYVRRSEWEERRTNKFLKEKYGNKTLKWNGLIFKNFTVRKGDYVIPLLPLTYAECIEKNIYMLRAVEECFVQ